MKNVLLVGMGGFLGAASRYLLTEWVGRYSRAGGFPLGTVVVNLLGCFVLGFLAGIGDHKGTVSHHIRLLLMVGVLGGFTTFSTFGHETASLFRDALPGQAVLNILISVVTGIIAAGVGYRLAHYL